MKNKFQIDHSKKCGNNILKNKTSIELQKMEYFRV